MNNYFNNQKDYLNSNRFSSNIREKIGLIELNDILGHSINEDIKYIYQHYMEFDLLWSDKEGKYLGEIHFIPYQRLVDEHENLVVIMNDCYDIEEDEFGITEDIYEWYPIFTFSNGDAFCLDNRNGKVVFYEHEVFDTGKNLHGLTIALTLNELFEKWSKLHFADVYYWDEVCDENGIDLKSELAQKYI